jgi:hypothetical protein
VVAVHFTVTQRWDYAVNVRFGSRADVDRWTKQLVELMRAGLLDGQ